MYIPKSRYTIKDTSNTQLVDAAGKPYVGKYVELYDGRLFSGTSVDSNPQPLFPVVIHPRIPESFKLEILTLKFPFPNEVDSVPTIKNERKGSLDSFMYSKTNTYPALGSYGNFTISSQVGERKFYKPNPQYKKFLKPVEVPLANSTVTTQVYEDFAYLLNLAFDEIKLKGLNQYITTFDGTWVVRNITGGTRLSAHAWGLGIDLNASIYPYGYAIKKDGVYTTKGVKVRDFTDFDKGFLEVADVMVSKGLKWLRNNDPMHFSLYE